MSTEVERLSRRVARALRHAPDLPSDGWVSVSALRRSLGITREELDAVLTHSPRFETDAHGTRIRARYGHSAEVVTAEPSEPPAWLYHGTSWAAVGAILRDGLSPMARSRVHLVVSPTRARERGAAVLVVDATSAHAHGIRFWDTDTGVWLAEHVPAQWIASL